MNFQLITEQPLWFIIFCIATGAAYAGMLYYRDQTFSELKPWLKNLMAAFRFIAVTILAFLLLTPLIRTISRKVEKPIIIFAQDNSASVLLGKDSAFYKNDYRKSVESFLKEIGPDFELKTFSFGDHVSENLSWNYSDKQTDFSNLFDDLSVKYDNRNVGAIIIATDGLYNSGSSPLYAGSGFKVPFYTIALGDTTVRKDLVLTRANHNKTALIGNSFPLEIIIDARQCSGEQTTLSVMKDSAVLFSRQVAIGGNKFHTTVPVYIDAKAKGTQHYKIKLSALDGELTVANNETSVFVEVIESKQKVLMIANAPHPDIAAIKSAVEMSGNYEVKTAFAKDFTAGISEYNLIILHQVPSVSNNMKDLFEKINKSDVSLLYILGAQTNISAFNALNSGLTIGSSNNSTSEVQGLVEQNFSLFTITDETKRMIESMPPMLSPFGVYKLSGNDYVLLQQKIGNISTDQPLLLFNQSNERKTGVLAGEGIWKWRMKEYSEKNSQAVTNDFIQKIVQYLSVKEKKSPFKVKYKNSFNENEQIVFDAELYNESDELINAPDVKITITSRDGKTYPYTFTKTDKAYTLNAGYYPVGNYSFKAETKLGEKIYSSSGQFTVVALQMEQAESIADHQLLFTLSERSGGKMVYPKNISSIKDEIEKRKDITSVSYTQKELKDLINLKWVFFLIIAFISAEWFLRKRSGGY